MAAHSFGEGCLRRCSAHSTDSMVCKLEGCKMQLACRKAAGYKAACCRLQGCSNADVWPLSVKELAAPPVKVAKKVEARSITQNHHTSLVTPQGTASPRSGKRKQVGSLGNLAKPLGTLGLRNVLLQPHVSLFRDSRRMPHNSNGSFEVAGNQGVKTWCDLWVLKRARSLGECRASPV
jgi:hypothetical protein